MERNYIYNACLSSGEPKIILIRPTSPLVLLGVLCTLLDPIDPCRSNTMSNTSTLPKETLHKLILKSFEGQLTLLRMIYKLKPRPG
jgi:hypothetical protein